MRRRGRRERKEREREERGKGRKGKEKIPSAVCLNARRVDARALISLHSSWAATERSLQQVLLFIDSNRL